MRQYNDWLSNLYMYQPPINREKAVGFRKDNKNVKHKLKIKKPTVKVSFIR